ncbi:Transmembrane protein [Ceratobasidium theobromae]|uniref:Transmembrane protein n=1 Tax=Ceratobasidium theobromae TaxID=1582974 RepID=A0A5N5QII1_9AGAM|nr:Transmembrane protein [Ceratobasidium theobromae]
MATKTQAKGAGTGSPGFRQTHERQKFPILRTEHQARTPPGTGLQFEPPFDKGRESIPAWHSNTIYTQQPTPPPLKEFDQPGAELDRGARVCKTHVQESDRVDAERVDGGTSIRSLDVILISAVLFSAISTAFVIESYKNLEQDPADVSAIGRYIAIVEPARDTHLLPPLVAMSVISNTPRPDEGPPTAPPNIVSAPADIPPPSPARSESNGVGPDRITLGVTALEAGRDAPYKNTRSHKHIAESPTTVAGIQAELARTERSLAPTPSTGIKCEISLPRTVVDEDQTTYIPPACPEHINIVVDDPSPQRTPRTGHSIFSQLPAPQEINQLPPLNPIPEGCIPSTAPTPQPGALLTTDSETVQIAKSIYECTLGVAFENLGKGFVFPMSYPEKEAITKLLPDTFLRFQKELHQRVRPVEGCPIALSPHENDVWTEIFAAAHSFVSELSHYLGLLGMPFAEGSMPPTPTIPSPPHIPSSFSTNLFSTEKLISSAGAIQAAVFAVHGRLISDSNALDIAHDLACAKRASNEQVEARGSAAPSGALAAPCENLPDRAGHGTAPAYMDAAPASALGLSLGSASLDPYGSFGHPTAYDSFGHPLIANPLQDPPQDPHSRAFSQISWATSTAPPHETHPVKDSVPPTPAPTPVPVPPKSQLPSGLPEIAEFTKVSRRKKGKNKGFSSSVQTPKKSFAAVTLASLPVSGIQRELAKINKPSSAPAALPSGVIPVKPKQTKQSSPPPSGNLDLIIKVSTDLD